MWGWLFAMIIGAVLDFVLSGHVIPDHFGWGTHFEQFVMLAIITLALMLLGWDFY
jgi:hypothetical protein